MDTERLDEFSRAVAARLFERFPAWLEFAKSAQADDGKEYLLVEVAAPKEAMAAYGLTIDTSDNEVTVGFDHSHIHASTQVGDGERFGAEYALHFIDRLLSERAAVVSWWKEGSLVAFSTIENGKPLLDDEIVGPYDHLRIRSWKGLMNADVNA